MIPGYQRTNRSFIWLRVILAGRGGGGGRDGGGDGGDGGGVDGLDELEGGVGDGGDDGGGGDEPVDEATPREHLGDGEGEEDDDEDDEDDANDAALVGEVELPGDDEGLLQRLRPLSHTAHPGYNTINYCLEWLTVTGSKLAIRRASQSFGNLRSIILYHPVLSVWIHLIK